MIINITFTKKELELISVELLSNKEMSSNELRAR
jgi:hypothetical protein